MRKRACQEPPRLVNEALLYHDDEELRQVLRSFVADGHAAGEPVLAALPAHNVEVLLPVLGPLTREVRFEDMAVVGRNPNCVLDLYRDWIGAHDGPVRLIGEVIWWSSCAAPRHLTRPPGAGGPPRIPPTVAACGS
jgi:MEDS: MEthanogen/methylotroph, DcmR Sensory domain